MTVLRQYNLCIAPGDDRFRVKLDEVSRLIDFLDSKMYLEGPDRDYSRLVLLSRRETTMWEPYLRDDPEAPIQPLRRRHVHVLHSPAAPEDTFRNYGQLLQKLDNLLPRDTPFVASLGYGTRKLNELIYTPVPGQARRWIESTTLHLVQGYHPAWRRAWDENHSQPEWELIAVKAFTFMISCKLARNVEAFTSEEFIETVRLKMDFVQFLRTIGDIIGTKDFELLGGTE